MPMIATAPIHGSTTSWKWRQSRPRGCSRLYDFTSGMVPRPLMMRSWSSSWSSLTASAVGLTVLGCCAEAGVTAGVATSASPNSATSANKRRKVLSSVDIACSSFLLVVPSGRGSRDRDRQVATVSR
jgi:hypothetical protein